MRCSDAWYQGSLLAESREGRLCADNNFFFHWVPTTLVGSMIPGEAAPRCGNTHCVELHQGEWAMLFQSGAKAVELP